MTNTQTFEFLDDPELLRAELEGADAATLLLVLVQLTGDTHILARARLHIAGPMNYQETMPEELRGEIRERLTEALIDYARSGRPLPPIPEGGLLREMLSAAVGEEVSEDYVAMMREDLGASEVDPRGLVWRTKPAKDRLDAFPVVIIGAGMSGICAAVRLREAGIPFTVIEKNSAVGGSWFENFYPGCGVDTPNHFYSYSFDLNHDWSHFFAKRDELWDYFQRAADKYDIRSSIQFDTEVVSAIYQDGDAYWKLTLRRRDGSLAELNAKAIISAVGILNRPKLPDIPGRAEFAGVSLHTAQWDKDFDWRDKRVAMIGTGASGQQVGPTIAGEVKSLTIFQRSPHWVVPNPNYFAEVSHGMKWALAHIPFFTRWYRFQLFWAFADGLHASLMVDPLWEDDGKSINETNARHRSFMERYLQSQLNDRPDLVEKATPSYPPYGKRILVDNNWFKMLKRPNVELVTEGIAKITPAGIETADGQMFDVDAIVYATGFQASKMLAPMTIRGRGDRDLHEFWGKDDAQAYLGTMIPDFPNFFTLMGPNTGLAHGGNVIFITECQTRFILACLREVLERGVGEIEVKRDIHDAHVAEVDALHAKMVWTHKGLNNWYRNANGRVFALLPYRLVDYWKMTKEFFPNNFNIS